MNNLNRFNGQSEYLSNQNSFDGPSVSINKTTNKVYYNRPKFKPIIITAKVDAVSTMEPVKLMNPDCINLFSAIEIDGVSLPRVVSNYTFETILGNHDVKYTLAGSLPFLKSKVFKDCIDLIQITFDENIRSIGEYAFDGCIGLTRIELPDNIHSIENYAFNNCSSLLVVQLGSRISHIGDYAFNNCVALMVTNINSINPPKIGSDIFSGTLESSKIYVPKNSIEAYQTAEGWSNYSDRISIAI